MPRRMGSRRADFAETITSGYSLRSRHGYGTPVRRPSFPSNMTGPLIWSLPGPGLACRRGRCAEGWDEDERRLSTMVVFDMFGAGPFEIKNRFRRNAPWVTTAPNRRDRQRKESPGAR